MSKARNAADSPAPLPDLDSPAHIQQFLQLFYERLLNDPELAPIFLEVAGIDVRVHLGHIQAYWEKLLLKENAYHRHTMNIHRALHAKQALTERAFDRWLAFFRETLANHFSGPYADRALQVAGHIASNMKAQIVRRPVPSPAL